MSKYSLIIKNGTVFDGKGNKPVLADVGVSGDEIKKIGDLRNEPAQNIVDASGKYVTPGFIDITGHSDTHWTLFSSPFQRSLIAQGVTTVFGGNCGTSLAPFLGESSAKEISRWVDVSKLNFNWRSMGEFLTEMEKRRIGINFGTFVGLNTIRRAVMEENQRTAKIKLLLKNSLKEGAFGVSTNFGLSELSYMNDSDIVEILKAAEGQSILVKHHLEDEGENILPAISRLIGTSRAAKCALHISHFKSLGRSSWDAFSGALAFINNARASGIKITYDFFPYSKTGSSLLMLLPMWFRKYSRDEALSILSSKTDKRRDDLKNSLKRMTLHYDKIIVATAVAGIECAGKTMERLAVDSGQSGEETILTLLSANDLRVSIFNEVIAERNVDAVAADPYSVISSDGVGYDFSKLDLNDLPHPRSFGAFPKFLDMFVKKKKILSWEQALCKMSGQPAEIVGLKDRGALENGKKADIVVFDPETVADEATYDYPYKYPRGISEVFVNGEAVITAGKFTNNLSGKAIKRQ
ncbi:MAG: amidohydrolase family protein [Candidatus Pacebacteria bacterium]|nr:amidohydrolase family protein [Candidatus Paceibacterota bacterium]NUQ57409.1 amidohydrolase family protein [Candidatus Paceibacter sp.]